MVWISPDESCPNKGVGINDETALVEKINDPIKHVAISLTQIDGRRKVIKNTILFNGLLTLKLSTHKIPCPICYIENIAVI